MKDSNLDIFLQNVFYLSSLTEFNAERSQLILKFYDHAFRDRILFEAFI